MKWYPPCGRGGYLDAVLGNDATSSVLLGTAQFYKPTTTTNGGGGDNGGDDDGIMMTSTTEVIAESDQWIEDVWNRFITFRQNNLEELDGLSYQGRRVLGILLSVIFIRHCIAPSNFPLIPFFGVVSIHHPSPSFLFSPPFHRLARVETKKINIQTQRPSISTLINSAGPTTNTSNS